MRRFKKSHIKNGAIIELRNKELFLKVNNTLLNLALLNLTRDGDFISLSSYDKKLCHKKYEFFDIMRVLNPNKKLVLFENSRSAALFVFKTFKNISWTWEREDN